LADAVASRSAEQLPVPTADEDLRTLTDAVERLAQAGRMQDVERLVCAVAQRMTGAESATLVPRDGGEPSYTDELTGLPDRRSCDAVLAQALLLAEQPVCVVLLDFDRSESRDPAGDELLRAAAQLWSDQLRPGEVLARYGGEEFAVLLRRCDAIAALAIAERLRLATPSGRTVSVGVAQWDGAESAASLVCRADEGLFRARQHGRDRVALAG